MEDRCQNAKIALALVALLFSAGCANPSPPRPGWQCPVELQPGDLIYRFGNGFFSAYFRDFSTRERRYSHVGIVVQTAPGDSLRIAHAEASELTGMGFVKAEPLASFLSGAHCWAVYRLAADSATRTAVAACALDFCQRRVPFDKNFDATDSSAVYCTELMARCVNAALGKPLVVPHTRHGGKAFLAIDDTYRNPAIQPVYQSNPSLPSTQ